MTKEQMDERIGMILRGLDILKCSVHQTLDGFEAEDAETYNGMFDDLYKQIEGLKS